MGKSSGAGQHGPRPALAGRHWLTAKGEAAVAGVKSGHTCPCACLCFCEGVTPLVDLGCQTPCGAAQAFGGERA